MRNIFKNLSEELSRKKHLVLATLLDTKGSVPQVTGSSAVFSDGKLMVGTLGGGIMEGDATQKVSNISGSLKSLVYNFSLNSNITSDVGAICGGSALLLLDANPAKSKEVFEKINYSVSNGEVGVLVTVLRGEDEVNVNRFWIKEADLKNKLIPDEIKEYEEELVKRLANEDCNYLKESESKTIFLQAIFPLPKLIIIGAGHIGSAMSHMANLLDFEITVIDDRPEYANSQNLPDADHIVVGDIGDAVRRIPKTSDTYIVLVSRGHRDDTEALKACIDAEVPYIGMIGSKRKVALMRENFIANPWATAELFDRIHAPVGIEINSNTIQEIAISICAQLIQIRNQEKAKAKPPEIHGIILAAGESKRMGKPKMLLPFGDLTIIEKVVSSASHSLLNKVHVVLGSGADSLQSLLQNYNVETIINTKYENGMLSSVQCGLNALPSDTDAVMVILGDQPMIETFVLDKVIEAYRHTKKEIIIASHEKKRGHPILIGAKYIQEIIGFSFEKSLRDLLQKYPEDIEEVELNRPEILRDIDTEKDYNTELKQQNND